MASASPEWPPVGVRTNELAVTLSDLVANSAGQIETETAECVRRARAGDAAAFAELVQRHERMVLRTAWRLLGTLDRAQDAAQETFLRLHRYLGRFDESRELGPWLYRVVVNVCHDLGHRAPAGRHVSMDELHESEHPISSSGADAVHATLEQAQQRRLVRAALLSLPKKERAALVLRDIEGRPTAEVAEILGSSEGTVRSQISTARVKIKRLVEKAQERGK
jgi:RNA polymerase sigma-70 factor (ECF subfamily)